MRKAFSITELIIVAAIIGILAALCMPSLHNHAAKAKEAAAKDNLRVLREAIKFYAVHHSDTAPGYPGNDRTAPPTEGAFRLQLMTEQQYLREMPVNPLNKLNTMHIIGNADELPAEGAGDYGWIYQPATGTIRLDWPGQGDDGIPYADY